MMWRKKHKEDGLENYHPGKAAWNNFCRVHEQRWLPCPFKDELINRFYGDKNLAIAFYSIYTQDALKLLDEKIDDLDGLTPVQCVQQNLKKRLESMLMRAP